MSDKTKLAAIFEGSGFDDFKWIEPEEIIVLLYLEHLVDESVEVCSPRRLKQEQTLGQALPRPGHPP